VRAALKAGLGEVARTAERSGMEGPLRELPSLALGAQEQTPLAIAEAYGTLANHGQRVPLTAIRQVAEPDGKLLESRPLEVEPAVSPQASSLVLDILEAAVRRGTARALRPLGVTGTVAGKTGTSNESRDSWFVGITPRLLVLVWVGRDDNGPTRLTGATGALPIYARFARGAGIGTSHLPFPLPPGVMRVEIDRETGGLAVPGCAETESAAVLADHLPSVCAEHGKVGFWRRLLRGGER
jgi:penicillin-binding protein 1B